MVIDFPVRRFFNFGSCKHEILRNMRYVEPPHRPQNIFRCATCGLAIEGVDEEYNKCHVIFGSRGGV